jgi:hypothetical protein
MGQKHRLGVLHVGAARHGHVEVLIGLPHKGVDDVQHESAQAAGVVAQVHPEQRGHLVVARAAGAKPATDISPGTLDQASLAVCTSSSSSSGPKAPD